MSIGCIIIIYKTDIKSLYKKIKNIYKEVDNFYIINNSKKKAIFKNKKFQITNLDVNLGIASAQNLALLSSFKNKNDYVLFSDQDTIFPKNFIKDILNFYIYSNIKYGKLFAVAPNLYDRNKKVLSGFVKRFFFFRNNLFNNNNKLNNINHCKITEAMSSGMFVNMKILRKIGFLNENYFLDWVDFDLCWRAINEGYNIVGAPNIIASHFLGNNSVKIFNKSFHIHKPFRAYYIVRNGFNLSLYSKNINFFWKINIFLNTLRYSLGYFLLMRPFNEVCKYIFLGFLHGLFNRLGKINHEK